MSALNNSASPVKRFALPAIVAVLVAAGVVWFVRGTPANTPNAANKTAAPASTTAVRPAMTVTVERPQTSTLAQTLLINGSIAAWQEAVIGADVNGLRIANVLVNVGDSVKKGQVLATFDGATVGNDLAAAQASLAEAEAAAANAAVDAARARALIGSGALSAQQIEQMQTGEKTAKARVAAARAQVASAGQRVRNTQVVAPDNGVISSRTATVGAVAGPGVELFRMVRQGRIEWRGDVAAPDVPQLHAGQRVSLDVPGASAPIIGRVRQVSPTLDPRTRFATVYVDLPAGGVARPGMFAKGLIETGSRNGLTIAQDALVMRDGFANVFKLVDGQRVQIQRIQAGAIGNGRVSVISGLNPGDTLVVNGAAFLNDGDTVKVVLPPSTPATAVPPAAPTLPTAPASAAH